MRPQPGTKNSPMTPRPVPGTPGTNAQTPGKKVVNLYYARKIL